MATRTRTPTRRGPASKTKQANAKAATTMRPVKTRQLDRPAPPSPVGVPCSLALSPRGSAARTGRAALEERVHAHHETSPVLTGGDLDADWVAAYSVGDEAPGGDNPTPGQTVVDEFGRALGLEYGAEEELRGPEKVSERDRHRWELDPASAEDYAERARPEVKTKASTPRTK